MVLPEAMAQRAREFTGPPVPARPAATVVLLRPSGPAFQVYVLRRAKTMVFGGLYAFPGGAVDPSDRPATVRADWAARLGVPDEQARAVVGAAARELFEEAGVLLAGPGVIGVDAPDWEADRLAVLRRELTMTELLERRGLRLRDDLLLPWARWVTPEFEPRRYDTWFFAALLPDGQQARDVSGEADRTAWIDPDRHGDLPMLPPTRHTLHQLAGAGSVDAVVAASLERDAATPLNPRVEAAPDGRWLLRVPDQPNSGRTAK
ncbi:MULTISPECIES: NUDIX domain-containing protein [Actinoplanes]|uniref:NUDIX hydrolase n=1 Tax=Actinoplanes TaxID=1865 RepID=UPI000AEEC17E|nr:MULTISPECIES: NUDIX domain-containing protein [Actinoplanes]GLY08015.1 hypothetical protein Acsp01_83940 [Actinoplanes sp. NBRC 101535]